MGEQRRIRLAIIGAGPKAVAIAAKASVLNRTSFGGIKPVKFEVVVFEPNAVGANWSGGPFGYTDGDQHLCTTVERDLGFPYASELAGRIEALAKPQILPDDLVKARLRVDGQRAQVEVAKATRLGSLIDLELQQQFSWSSFLTSQGDYRRWIDSGRKPPPHRQFATYLQWAFAQTDAKLVKSRVNSLQVADKKWRIRARSVKGRGEQHEIFDGVVATGPGPASSSLPKPVSSAKVFDGVSFWIRLHQVRKVLDQPWSTIAILGGGGTGAAVLAWLARNGYCGKEITLIADQATVYTRTDNWFENRLFSDTSLWNNLSSKSQRDFFDRVNRGVVWNNIVSDLEKLANLTVVDGRAKRVRLHGGELEISVPDAVSSKLVRASIVVDATGFDLWYFIKMVPAGLVLPSTRDERRRIKDQMTEYLDWEGDWWPFPPLHAPMLADKLGPGLGSLMSLGAMSDRVLGRYLT